MKICFLSTQSDQPWCGSERLWAAGAEEALRQGHEVAILLPSWPELPAPLADLRARGARLVIRPKHQRSRAVRLFERHVAPLPGLVRWRPDVVCVSLSTFYDLAYRNDVHRFLAACRAPYVTIVQQLWDHFHMHPDEGIRPRILAYMRGSARVAFVSDQNRRSAERQLAGALPNGCVVRNPVNLDRVEAVPWPSSADDAPRLASVARLDVNDKGQDVLFEVLSRPAWAARPWSLHLYGRGRNEAYLKELARSVGIAGRVTFHGQVRDVRALWAEDHLMVLPSRVEGTPLALVEAMLCGRPAVVSDVGGNVEWIDEPRNGFIAEAPTPRSFGAALERAWEARGRWEALGANAHEDATRLADRAPGATLLDLLLEAARGRPTVAPTTAPASPAPRPEGIEPEETTCQESA